MCISTLVTSGNGEPKIASIRLLLLLLQEVLNGLVDSSSSRVSDIGKGK